MLAGNNLKEEELVAFANECLARSVSLARVDLSCERSLRALALIVADILTTRGADNSISDKAAEAIAAALLQKNTSLKSIKLRSAFCRDVLLLLRDQARNVVDCQITVAGIKAICASLKLNDTLTSIDLECMLSDACTVCL